MGKFGLEVTDFFTSFLNTISSGMAQATKDEQAAKVLLGKEKRALQTTIDKEQRGTQRDIAKEQRGVAINAKAASGFVIRAPLFFACSPYSFAFGGASSARHQSDLTRRQLDVAG